MYLSIQAKKLLKKVQNGFYEANSQIPFSIDTVTLYHSATATQNTEIKKTFMLNIHQFTDISFNINNPENIVIKKLWIDNITYSDSVQNGSVFLTYKNPLEFGKIVNTNPQHIGSIDFSVLNTNIDTNFAVPYVYNNLSNPITFEFLHKNVVENFNTSTKNMTLEYNGKLLKETNVNLENISCNVSFDVNIIDINDNQYTSKLKIPIKLTNNNSSIYEGELLETVDVKSTSSFFRK